MATIYGVTRNASGVACQALVRAHRRSDGKLSGQAISDATTGAYSITTLDTSPHVVYRLFGSITAGDINWSDVVLAMRFDGVNNSTSFVDECGHATTANGDARLSTASPKFGTACGVFDGSGDYVTVPAGADTALVAAKWTVQLWFRTTQTTNCATLLTREWAGATTAGGYSIQLHDGTSGPLVVHWADFSTSTYLMRGTKTTHCDGNWHHLAWVKDGTSHTLFLDGAVEATATTSATGASVLKPITIGSDLTFGGGARAFNGAIDDLQIVNRALYASAFSVPTTPFAAPLVIGAPTENAQIFDYVIPI